MIFSGFLRLVRALVFGGVVAMAGVTLTAGPAMAGPSQSALLQSYVGNWKGSGMLKGGDQPEKFVCRIMIAKGGADKINYAGRCAVAGLNLSVAGTIAYNDAASRYEGAMSSNTKFSGMAVGRQRGGAIVFDFRKSGTTEKGNDVSLTSQITLKNSRITVDFDVKFADSDKVMTTSVPFSRS